jgi:hypothetical protein
LLKQIGAMWGTLLGLRGYSLGESFVSRNVGLRTIWTGGKWCVKLIFQDNDNLVLPGEGQTEFWPMTAMPHTILDDVYINGIYGKENPEFELDALRRIYRVDEEVEKLGRKRLRWAMKDAYAKTQIAIVSDPEVKASFHERFVERLRDWDAVARIYLGRNGSADVNDWKPRVERFLKERGYADNSIAYHCRALETHKSFVETYSFLYRSRSRAPRTNGRLRGGASR